VSALARSGLNMTGDWRTQATYLDIHGVTRPAQLVPPTVAGGELERLRNRRLAVVGVASVGEYDAETTARTVAETLDADVTPALVDLDLGPAASLTDLFGRPAPTPSVTADVILYPPGFCDLPENGVELLSTIPSPHGLRLHRALMSALEKAGVETRRQTIAEVAVDARTVRSVGGVEADAFVLAPGRYLGGGLVKQGTVREPLFDLGVFHEGRRVDRERAARLRHLEYLSPEPAFRTGLLADERLRPLSWEGKPAYDNLLAAGSVLGGYDYGREFGFGVPVLTGWLAGGWAAS
jgi:anaerobic glycerol-3-phosphate dehydrogenase